MTLFLHMHRLLPNPILVLFEEFHHGFNHTQDQDRLKKYVPVNHRCMKMYNSFNRLFLSCAAMIDFLEDYNKFIIICGQRPTILSSRKRLLIQFEQSGFIRSIKEGL